jgi:hypothetical protein
MKHLSLVILVGMVMSSVLVAGQEVYRWVDEKGTVHFADDMSQIPEKYRGEIQKRSLPQAKEPSQPAGFSSPPAPLPPPPGPPGGPPGAMPPPGPMRPNYVRSPSDRKDILGRGEDWWRGQVREWNAKLAEAQKNYEAAAADLKNKQNELDQAKFKPDSLKRKLRAEIKDLEEKTRESKKEMDEAKNMLEKGLFKQAEEYKADPIWLR